MRLRAYYKYLIASTLVLISTGTVSSSADTSEKASPDAIAEVDTPPQAASIVPVEFLTACTEGDSAGVEAFLKAHPDYLNGRSADGETCLHVAGIYGHAHIAELVLQAGGDANIRSTFTGGLRMTPLSWNVYGGHLEAAKVLLQHGAQVNLDFDAPNGKDSIKKVTVYDALTDILNRSSGGGNPQQQKQNAKEDPGMERYWELKQLLEKHGAKRYAELADEL